MMKIQKTHFASFLLLPFFTHNAFAEQGGVAQVTNGCVGNVVLFSWALASDGTSKILKTLFDVDANTTQVGHITENNVVICSTNRDSNGDGQESPDCKLSNGKWVSKAGVQYKYKHIDFDMSAIGLGNQDKTSLVQLANDLNSDCTISGHSLIPNEKGTTTSTITIDKNFLEFPVISSTVRKVKLGNNCLFGFSDLAVLARNQDTKTPHSYFIVPKASTKVGAIAGDEIVICTSGTKDNSKSERQESDDCKITWPDGSKGFPKVGDTRYRFRQTSFNRDELKGDNGAYRDLTVYDPDAGVHCYGKSNTLIESAIGANTTVYYLDDTYFTTHQP